MLAAVVWLGAPWLGAALSLQESTFSDSQLHGRLFGIHTANEQGPGMWTPGPVGQSVDPLGSGSGLVQALGRLRGI